MQTTMALFRSTARFLSSSVARQALQSAPRRLIFRRCLSSVTAHHENNSGKFPKNHACGQFASPLPCSVRHYSEPSSSPENYCVTFEDLRNHIRKEDILLVDVRDPGELQTYGFIPTSVNIPLRELPDALNMSAEMFQARYGRSLPSTDGHELVFHCMAGIRSKRALQLAWDRGYTKARHYPGGFDEWEVRTKKKE